MAIHSLQGQLKVPYLAGIVTYVHFCTGSYYHALRLVLHPH